MMKTLLQTANGENTATVYDENIPQIAYDENTAAGRI